MTNHLKASLLVLALIICTCLNAQIEVAHLKSKSFSATGFGGFLNFAIPVSDGSSVTADVGFLKFKSKDDYNIVVVPMLLGYRYTFDGSGTGLYVEPTVGYSIGATDIEKYDANGSPIPDGDEYVEQQAKGITAGIGTGYIFSGSVPINIGVRYNHVFVSDDPTLNIFSLRLSYPIRFGGRE